MRLAKSMGYGLFNAVSVLTSDKILAIYDSMNEGWYNRSATAQHYNLHTENLKWLERNLNDAHTAAINAEPIDMAMLDLDIPLIPVQKQTVLYMPFEELLAISTAE